MAMKILLILGLVLVVLWWLRQARLKTRGDTPASPPRAPDLPTHIVECAHCHVHLPRHDACSDRQGRHFCCEAHLRETGRD